MGTHPKKLAILGQLRTHFKPKHEKSVGTPFPPVPAPLHPWLTVIVETVLTIELYLAASTETWSANYESLVIETENSFKTSPPSPKLAAYANTRPHIAEKQSPLLQLKNELWWLRMFKNRSG